MHVTPAKFHDGSTLAVDQQPMGTGPCRFVSHTDDESFVFERFDDHYNPIDHPLRAPHVPHYRQMTGLVRPELQSRLAGLEAGEIDMVSEGVGVTGAKPYIDHPDYTGNSRQGSDGRCTTSIPTSSSTR